MDKIIVAIIAVVVLGLGGYWVWSANNSASSPTAATSGTQVDAYSTTTVQSAPQSAEPAPQQPITTNDTKKYMQATLHTNKGDITLEFLSSDAPNTVANFIKLAQSGYYDGTKFHRVIKGFMDQAGDPLTKDDTMMARWGTGGPGYQFADENVNASNAVGVVSMANSGPNTNGSQFFINAANNSFLDGKYSVFAKVVSGIDVVMAINNTPTDASDRPVTPVIINSVTLAN